ncbi:chain-length determining protein [Alginatibacterium sediminis]|uniref:Chain-length determining protein n=1 Tax=Alginatibacterium sediminis TaxID=2164068 RepID=A0A420EDM3_9ALTE|nr:GNVR domain-containing protein [Alginatibacterium sediminis]RKF18773.1 chain-length determining protein [Alginatibacterium sediminis]
MAQVLLKLYLFCFALWRRRYALVLPVLILPVVGLAVGSNAPKRYQAHTSMLIQETAKLNPFLEDLAVSSNLDSRMDALSTLLKSRHILSQVALDQGLFQENDSDLSKDQVIALLSRNLNVRLIGRDLIRIDYQAQSPEGMAQLLQSVSQQFIDQLLAPERSSIQDSQKFLELHLLKSSEQLQEAEDALAWFRTQNASSLPELYTVNAERLAQLSQSLVEKEAILAGAKQSLGTIDQQLSRTDPVLLRLEEQIVAQRSNLANLSSRYTDGHSKVLAVKRNLRRLEEERMTVLEQPSERLLTIEQGILNSQLQLSDSQSDMLVVQAQALLSARHKVVAAEEEVTQLRALSKSIESKLQGVGEQEQQLRELNRNLKVKRQLYENLLTRYEMAQVTGALGLFEGSERIKIIDRPYTPSSPSTLPLWMYAVAGLVAGLLLGFAIVVLSELCDSSLRTQQQVEDLLGLRVLSRIPPLKE